MEASARANLNFLEQLYLFHKQQKRVKISIPIIGGKPVDLWRLRKEVTALGGVETVRTVHSSLFSASDIVYRSLNSGNGLKSQL